MQNVWMLNDNISNVFNFQQRLFFPHSSNHRCNSWTQISAVTWQTVHKYIVAHAFHSRRSLPVHTLPVFSHIFLLQSPQAVEWWLERHHFSDACRSQTSSNDEFFLEQNASATHLHEQFVYVTLYIYIYIYIYMCMCVFIYHIKRYNILDIYISNYPILGAE